MIDLGLARIAGHRTTRTSLFSGAASDSFGGQRGYPEPRALGYRALGQSAQSFYDQAKQQIARFDSLATRTTKIANKAARDQIIQTYGLNDPTNNNLAAYMRNALQSDVSNAESYTPIAYEQGFPTHGPARGRVSKLKDFNDSFQSDVEQAENTYGILPDPQVITQYITTPGSMNWTWIVPIAGVAVLGLGIAWALGAFGRK